MAAISLICPACNKDNETSPEEMSCRRCGADLEPILRVSAAAEATRLLGAAALRRNDLAEALAYASQSWDLKPNAATAKLAALACAACRDLDGVMYWRQRTR